MRIPMFLAIPIAGLMNRFGASSEDIIRFLRGPKPEFDPVKNYKHSRQAEEARKSGGRVDELDEERRDIQRQKASHTYTPPAQLVIALFFLFVAELLGSILILRELGYEGAERIVLGAMLASFVFFIAGCVARTPQHTKLFYFLLFVAGVVVIALTAARRSSLPEDERPLTSFATLVTGVVLSTGPAALTEVVLRRRRGSIGLRRREKTLTRQIRHEEKNFRKHDTAIKRHSDSETRWKSDVAVLEAFINSNRTKKEEQFREHESKN